MDLYQIFAQEKVNTRSIKRGKTIIIKIETKIPPKKKEKKKKK